MKGKPVVCEPVVHTPHDAGPELVERDPLPDRFPTWTRLDYELQLADGSPPRTGTLRPAQLEIRRFDYGFVPPGVEHHVTAILHGISEGATEEDIECVMETPFSILANRDQQSRTRLLMQCSGGYRQRVEATFVVVGGEGACPALHADSTSAVVGESIPFTADGPFSLAVDPYGIVGELELLPGDRPVLHCIGPGKVTIFLIREEGPCMGLTSSLDVECTPRPGDTCCPIDPIDDRFATIETECKQLGGSPPCFTGCACLRHGGHTDVRPDQNGCLEWDADRDDLGSGFSNLCLDKAHVPSPDPRKPCGSYVPSEGSEWQLKPCDECALRKDLDPFDTVCPSSADRSCDPTGRWHISFIQPKNVPHPPCNPAQERPPYVDIELSYPDDFTASANGCDLTYVHTETLVRTDASNGCGPFGYSLFLQIEAGDADRASGSLRAVAGCRSSQRRFATAERLGD